jgi:hypothetical protein
MSKYTLVDTSCCKMAKVFKFVTEDGITYNLSGHGMLGQLRVPYIDVGGVGGITKLLTSLNSGGHLEHNFLQHLGPLNWMIGEFSSSKDGIPVGSVRVLPVASYKEATPTTPAVLRQEFIMDNTHKVGGGGSLYDNKGKLLYRGEMKNGVPHGYGTGYYANGKVGHTGMFKGGKIVQ